MDGDNSDGETKIKSENPTHSSTASNRSDEKASNPSTSNSTTTSSSTIDASASNKSSDSVPVASTCDRIKPSESSAPFSLMSNANNPSASVIDGQSCNVNKVSVSSSETVSNASSVGNAIGDSGLNDVNIKQEIIDRDSPSPNLPSYAVSKHSVSGNFFFFVEKTTAQSRVIGSDFFFLFPSEILIFSNNSPQSISLFRLEKTLQYQSFTSARHKSNRIDVRISSYTQSIDKQTNNFLLRVQISRNYSSFCALSK